MYNPPTYIIESGFNMLQLIETEYVNISKNILDVANEMVMSNDFTTKRTVCYIINKDKELSFSILLDLADMIKIINNGLLLDKLIYYEEYELCEQLKNINNGIKNIKNE